MASPSSNSSRLLKRISIISSRPRPFRVAVLGQNGVGKTALAVRFVTRRYIGEYDPFLERVYNCQRSIQGNMVDFEVLDTAGLNENSKLKEHIRWADAIVLMYDVTDRCSFIECSRLKFLINAHSRRSRRRSGSDPDTELSGSIPVSLVANKKDKEKDRMVLVEEGANRSLQLNCVSFNEVSVREDLEDIVDIFEELYSFCKKQRKYRFLGSSKLSLNVEKVGSSSEEDAEDKEGSDSISVKNGGAISPGGRSLGNGSRRGTLFAPAPEILPDSPIQRVRSRRREAFYTFS
ncbi:ras-related and estrogen-regulated growth inhibitor [Aplysia californica]|uniref:small monomeric GTPase n=1 Tax=Aplysia californica TaxID=6500 RepID=A0ABM0JWE0_APLCA|nr:ras-related and estrogen-regulated growth inhibitor [Aplysia californica]XP_012940665.1 ras-related and estrogen-regulated growth inhibitor [Aplysia californica]